MRSESVDRDEVKFKRIRDALVGDMRVSAGQLRKIFRKFGHNPSGTLSHQDLQKSLVGLGIGVEKKDMGVILRKCDPEGKGVVPFASFAEALDIPGHRKKYADSPGKPKANTVVGNETGYYHFFDAKVQKARGESMRRMDFLDKEVSKLKKAIYSKAGSEYGGSVGNVLSAYDATNCGSVTYGDFQRALKHIGVDLPRNSLEMLFRSVDSSGSGRVDIATFDESCKTASIPYGMAKDPNTNVQSATEESRKWKKEMSEKMGIDARGLQVELKQEGGTTAAQANSIINTRPSKNLEQQDVAISKRVVKELNGRPGRLRKVLFEKDTNKNGIVTRSDVKQGLNDLGVTLGSGEVERILNRVDPDQNDAVDYQNLTKMLVDEAYPSEEIPNDAAEHKHRVIGPRVRAWYGVQDEEELASLEKGREHASLLTKSQKTEILTNQKLVERLYFRRGQLGEELLKKDPEHTGMVSKDELKTSLKNLNANVSDHDVVNILHGLSTDSSGTKVNYQELTEKLEKVRLPEWKKFSHATVDIPENVDQPLGSSNLVYPYSVQGDDVVNETEAAVKEIERAEKAIGLFQECDPQHQGIISKEDFLSVVNSNKLRLQLSQHEADKLAEEHQEKFGVSNGIVYQDFVAALQEGPHNKYLKPRSYRESDYHMLDWVQEPKPEYNYDPASRLGQVFNETGHHTRRKSAAPIADGVRDVGYQNILKDLLSKVGNRKERLFAAFKKYDGDNDGCLTFQEFKQTLLQLNIPVTQADLSTMVKAQNADKDGLIDYHKLSQSLNVVSSTHEKCLTPYQVHPRISEKVRSKINDIEGALKTIDYKNEGVLNQEEVWRGMRLADSDLKQEDFLNLLNDVGVTQNKKIDYKLVLDALRSAEGAPPDPSVLTPLQQASHETESAPFTPESAGVTTAADILNSAWSHKSHVTFSNQVGTRQSDLGDVSPGEHGWIEGSGYFGGDAQSPLSSNMNSDLDVVAPISINKSPHLKAQKSPMISFLNKNNEEFKHLSELADDDEEKELAIPVYSGHLTKQEKMEEKVNEKIFNVIQGKKKSEILNAFAEKSQGDSIDIEGIKQSLNDLGVSLSDGEFLRLKMRLDPDDCGSVKLDRVNQRLNEGHLLTRDPPNDLDKALIHREQPLNTGETGYVHTAGQKRLTMTQLTKREKVEDAVLHNVVGRLQHRGRAINREFRNLEQNRIKEIDETTFDKHLRNLGICLTTNDFEFFKKRTGWFTEKKSGVTYDDILKLMVMNVPAPPANAKSNAESTLQELGVHKSGMGSGKDIPSDAPPDAVWEQEHMDAELRKNIAHRVSNRRAQLRRAFKAFDDHHDFKVAKESFKKGLQRCGVNLTATEFDRVCSGFQPYASGENNYARFAEWFNSKESTEISADMRSRKTDYRRLTIGASNTPYACDDDTKHLEGQGVKPVDPFRHKEHLQGANFKVLKMKAAPPSPGEKYIEERRASGYNLMQARDVKILHLKAPPPF